MTNPLLVFGAPPDAAAWAALVGAVAALAFVRAHRMLGRLCAAPRATLLVLAALAASLSIAYVAYYLRGGPRIIDATSYFLEARALADGQLAFAVPEPSAAFRGRFLVNAPDSERLAVIFPPGYPALLALGFRLGAPLLVGPAIAAMLVVATFLLAKALFGRDDVALVAALMSCLSGALRHHTAETMSHGWAALLMTIALASAWRARAGKARWLIAISGLAAGALIATRPVTGLVGAALAGGVLLIGEGRTERLLLLAIATLPGVALLLLHQRAATGDFTSSSQLRYYALADGPPDCFRYGFGSVGCLYEHGDFVRARLGSGYGFREALGTTLRRLHHHALDLANFELFALVALIAAVIGRKLAAVRTLSIGIAGVVAAYVPFYFDGNYPGGGARFFADVLPLQHVLLGWGLVELGLARFAPALSLAGFALHAAYSHRALAEREGGRPMFEPSVLSAAGIERGLVFVDTDHGFNLGHEPSRADAARGVIVARARGDARDGLLWNRLGRPPAYAYRYDPFARASAPSIQPTTPSVSEPMRFEAEGDWPPLEMAGGWAYPEFRGTSCLSKGRGLNVRASAGLAAKVTLEVYVERAGPYDVVLGWEGRWPEGAELAFGAAALRLRASEGAALCPRSVPARVVLEPGPHRVKVSIPAPGALLDYAELSPAPR